MKKRLPPLPKSISLPAGRIPVARKHGLQENEQTAGKFDWMKRTIEIESELSDHPAWLTLRHERVHAVLMDAGIIFDNESLLERVCDAMAAADVYDMLHPPKVKPSK